MFKRNTFRGLAIVAGLVLAQPLLLQSAHAVDNMETSGDIDLTSVRAKIKAQDYKAALAELRDLAEDNQNADVYNLFGFTLRKTGDYATSLSYYTKALDLQPDHKAAREYLGELYRRDRPDGQGEGAACRADEALPDGLRRTRGSRKGDRG